MTTSTEGSTTSPPLINTALKNVAKTYLSDPKVIGAIFLTSIGIVIMALAVHGLLGTIGVASVGAIVTTIGFSFLAVDLVKRKRAFQKAAQIKEDKIKGAFMEALRESDFYYAKALYARGKITFNHAMAAILCLKSPDIDFMSFLIKKNNSVDLSHWLSFFLNHIFTNAESHKKAIAVTKFLLQSGAKFGKDLINAIQNIIANLSQDAEKGTTNAQLKTKAKLQLANQIKSLLEKHNPPGGPSLV